jgi:hypothetical protein
MRHATLICLLLCWARGLVAQPADSLEFFEKHIRPLLVNNCQGCHNARLKTAGLDLSTPEGIAHGGPAGPLVSKDDPRKSLLLRVLSYDDRVKMPPTGKLKPEELALIATWVASGGAVPGAAQAAAARPQNKDRDFTESEKRFWAFQKLGNPAPPEVSNKAWVKSPVDRFILAKLEQKGLAPAPPASKLALLRRVTFDLTGLPPTALEIKDFLADTSPAAFEKVVDRLLASPRYGEQWGRHWLDVARYGDSTGNDEDHRYPYAWRYRDYVIDSFNQDVPFDRFIKEQVAGDLLPPERPGALNARGVVATGFLALGPKAVAQQDKKKMLADIYDEQIDVVSKGFLGVTLSCARCHDHKFDPLLTRDYYAMLSIFANTRNFTKSQTHVSELLYTPLVSKQENELYLKTREEHGKKSNEIDDVIDSANASYVAAQTQRLAGYMLAARKVYRDGADAAAIAREQQLREDVLKKWVDYLKPGAAARPHLEEWEKAEEAKLAEVAEGYQKRFEARRAEVAKQMERMRRNRRRRQPMPAKLFDPAKDHFFYEVFFEGPFAVPEKEREKELSAEARQSLIKLRAELKTIEAGMPPEPGMACAVTEGQDNDPLPVQKIYVRGDYNSPGGDAPKGFPVILAGFEQPRIERGSGRLELAEWLARPDNPLTARVFANRVWYWHFGEGIVRTPDNFGKMGDRPTHPELLDYLARRFVEGGWSVKKLHRLILLSSAYQMGSQPADEAVAADLENQLFSRFPRRRLSVEEMRDGMLSLDGAIDLTMGGTLQSGFGTDGENSNDRLSVRPEVVKRRMVYLPLRRANLPTMRPPAPVSAP